MKRKVPQLDDLLARLGDLLKEETDVYSDILNVSKQKTAVIVEGKVAELEKIVKMEQSFIKKIASLENRREALVGELSGLTGRKPEELTISNIAGLSEGKNSETLKGMQRSMAALIDELCKSNEMNSRLVRNSLDYIDFSMSLFTNLGNEDNNYNPYAEKSGKKARNLFDLKV